MNCDIAIIGAGIAGMTAAIYAARAGKSVVMIEKEAVGGQITLSPRVENYPGFKEISGLDLADNVFNQALSLGVNLDVDEVRSIEKTDEGFKLTGSYTEHTAKAVVIATGLKHRRLEAAAAFEGEGVSYCAVCDGMFYRGKTVAVVGGGNTAVSDALYLADICEKVYLIHRRSGYRAEKAVLDRLLANEKIIRLENKVIDSMENADGGKLLHLKDTQGGADTDVAVAGLFVALGHIPQNDAFKDLVDLDEFGFVRAGEELLTKTPGIFVAGDCREKTVRQLTTAASDGASAGLAAAKYIDNL
ncbi:MAG: FAD-dependent oxidoreductase [Clostridiales bacterium]|nr:FAD-dependent oxidoreductase [Clostridiales bacterium]